ncbi:MAG: SCP2 sterol-binding domain-containing protein [Gammaproteobacteria bacterium]
METLAMNAATPQCPRPLSVLLGLVPRAAHETALVTVLNQLLAPALRRGELDFLRGRILRLGVTDMQLTFALTLGTGRLLACRDWRRPDLTIDGVLYDFLLLATRREDPDTLFFNRRLRLGGDTELGLYVKNFLAAQELDAGHRGVRIMNGATDLLERLGRRRA